MSELQGFNALTVGIGPSCSIKESLIFWGKKYFLLLAKNKVCMKTQLEHIVQIIGD